MFLNCLSSLKPMVINLDILYEENNINSHQLYSFHVRYPYKYHLIYLTFIPIIKLIITFADFLINSILLSNSDTYD